MLNIDVDDIAEVTYGTDQVEVKFKDGIVRIYAEDEMDEVLAVLNHWTPPTA